MSGSFAVNVKSENLKITQIPHVYAREFIFNNISSFLDFMINQKFFAVTYASIAI